jgi:hypothetical protein
MDVKYQATATFPFSSIFQKARLNLSPSGDIFFRTESLPHRLLKMVLPQF